MNVSTREIILVIILALINQYLFSQTKGVIIDKETGLPIAYVNVYTKNGDKVSGTISNENGEFIINFPFQTLYLTHLNYEKTFINDSAIKDTIFLKPSSYILGEIEAVTSYKQPKWIVDALERVLKDKNKKYQTREKIFSYQYQTQTLNDSNGYAFNSEGNIKFPLLNNNPFKINTKTSIIKYKDNTAGVDFSNLQRMMYDDFILNYDKSFIKDNIFRPIKSYNNQDNNIIQLSFSSKEYKDDNGYLIIDTLNNVILEIERNSGTDFNTKTHTSGFLRTAATVSFGLYYNVWVTKMNSKYTKIGQSYYLAECKYKYLMKKTVKLKKTERTDFTSIESDIHFNDKNNITDSDFIEIPKPYYLIAIRTKEMRLAEEALAKIAVSYEKF
ncbi:MAG: hypothetical protein H6Q19_1071 [Bacteroidetes bacterium]|nr:hypothetical protein [Bacteroidota bacterium]